MKRLGILFACVFLVGVLFGCPGWPIKPDVQQLLVKDGARLAGYELAKKYPQYTAEALAVLNVALEACKGDKAEVINTVFPSVIKELTRNIKDPLILLTINDVVDAIKVIEPEKPVSDKKYELIKVAISGFIEGIQIAQNAKALNQKMKVERPLLLKQ